MTTSKHINIYTIINMFNRSRSYSTIRAKYGRTKLNYNCLTVLLSIYLLTVVMKRQASKTNIKEFVQYFNYRLVCKYIDLLVYYELLTLSGRHYSLTDKGIEAIKEISDNNDNLLYLFCSKYNIEL